MSSRDQSLKEVFKHTPLEKTTKPSQGHFIRAVVARATKIYPTRQLKGMKEFGEKLRFTFPY